jgi:hypothetical protein
VAFIEEYGEEIVSSGGREAAAVIEAVPAARRSPRLRLLLGDALRVSGDATAAMQAFEPLLASAARTGEWAPGLVWRAAMVHT